MKNLYAFTDYKEFLNGYFAGPAAARGLRTRAAEAMQCQPAYLSQVLKGQAELTEDHAYKLGQFLEMTAVQAEYFGLLVRCSRASTPQLRRHLQQQAQALSKKGRGLAPDEPSEELDPQDEKMKKYFSSWLPSTVHFATQCEKYQKPAALAKKLGIDEAKTREVMESLAEMDFLKKIGKDQWEFLGPSTHMPRTPGLSMNIAIQRRLMALKSVQRERETDLHVAMIFPTERKYIEEIRHIMLKALGDSEKKVRDSECEELFGICMDLFEI